MLNLAALKVGNHEGKSFHTSCLYIAVTVVVDYDVFWLVDYQTVAEFGADSTQKQNLCELISHLCAATAFFSLPHLA